MQSDFITNRYIITVLMVSMIFFSPMMAFAARDVVVANRGQPNQICHGEDVGGFTCIDISSDKSNTNSVALGDVNSDGRLDAVFANHGAPNQVCLEDGAGNFACTDISDDKSNTYGVALGDVNSDGHPDAVLANYGSPSQVCLGSGSGNFTCTDILYDPLMPSPGQVPGNKSIALGDVNSDGRLDAVFAGESKSQVCVGDGAGNFTCNFINGASGTRSVALGYINSDRHLDAFFGYAPRKLCFGDGRADFTCSDIKSDNRFSTNNLALGDVNDDGHLDAVFAIDGAPNQVCLGDGAGDFTCSDIRSDRFSTQNVALGDTNGDGHLDAVFANDDAPNQVCLGDGLGNFICSYVNTMKLSTRSVALGSIVSSTRSTRSTRQAPKSYDFGWEWDNWDKWNTLIQDIKPIFVFTRTTQIHKLEVKEEYFPISVETYMEKTGIHYKSGGDLHPNTLPEMDRLGLIFDPPNNLYPKDIFALAEKSENEKVYMDQEAKNEKDYLQGGDLNDAKVYVHIKANGVSQSPSVVNIQFWVFYGENRQLLTPSGGTLPSSRHQADWEYVTLRVDTKKSKQERIIKVWFSQHSGGEWQFRDNIHFRKDQNGDPTSHPIVYVAVGSHANYPETGYSLLNYDFYSYPYKEWVPKHQIIAFDLDANLNEIGDHRWIYYTGHWGADGIISPGLKEAWLLHTEE